MSDVLQGLYQLDRSFAQELEKFLQNEKHVGGLQQLPEKELIQFVNYLNDTINRFTHIGVPSRKCLLVLRKICSAKKILTADYDVPGILSSPSGAPIAHGGSSDIFKGTLRTEVCIKKIRTCSSDNQDEVEELFRKEAVMWKHLDHPNVVAFKGITLNPLQLVSEWIPGGELREYIKKNPDANHANLLLGIAKGLGYLHSCDVIHGDLKGPNIVVDGSGNARIMDFGLASIIRAPSSVASNSDGHGFTPWWTAPEILQEGIPANMKSDIFSFGMIIYEAFSGKVPFHNVSAQAVQVNIMSGKRPKRPDHPELTDALWELAERCWAARAQDRPEVEEVIEILKKMNSSKIAQATKRPSTRLNLSDYGTPQKKIEDGGEGVIIPYDTETPPPVPTPPPPPNSGGSERPVHKAKQTVGGGTTDEPPPGLPSSAGNSSPLAVGSISGVVEREPLKRGGDARGFVEKDIGYFKETGGPREEPEEEGGEDVGRENQRKGAEHAVKTGEGEEPHKPAESTTTALAQTKVTHGPPPATRETLPDTGKNDLAGSSGSADNLKNPPPALSPGSGPDEDTTPTVRPAANQHANQPRDQTPKHLGVQSDQPPAQNPAGNRDKSAGQDQEKKTGAHADPLRLPTPKSEQPKPEPVMDPRKPSMSQPPAQSERKRSFCCCCCC